jgi:formate dehydrogenase subunit gamma
VSVSQTISSAPVASDNGGSIIRYTLSERINHWLAALTYIYCLMSGLAFWSPYLFWMATVLGGAPTARFWHPWFGLIFTVSVLSMYNAWQTDMRITDADRAWKKAIDHYIRNEDEMLPPIGRFNYGQKLFFWLMFYGVIVLLVSGFGLWFVESIPWSLRWLRYLAIFLHVSSALATIGAMIIHVYMGTAMVRGGFSSMVLGKVSAAWAWTHHRLWYERVTQQKTSQS